VKKQTQRKSKDTPKRDDSFEAVAKRLECDMDEKRFREKLGKIARAKQSASKSKVRSKV